MLPQLKGERFAYKITEERKCARVVTTPLSLLKKYVESRFNKSSKECPTEAWRETARESRNAILQLHL